MTQCGLGLLLFLALSGPARGDDVVRVVTLGDSITKGVRPGVKADETFTAYLGAALKEKGVKAEAINAGVGGEMTTQALKRLERDVLARKPRLVAIMYGTN